MQITTTLFPACLSAVMILKYNTNKKACRNGGIKVAPLVKTGDNSWSTEVLWNAPCLLNLTSSTAHIRVILDFLWLKNKINQTTLRLHKGLRIAYFWKTFNYSLQSKAFLMEAKWPPIAEVFFLLWQALRLVMIWRYYIPLHSSVSHCTVGVSDVLLWNWSVKISDEEGGVWRVVLSQPGICECVQ